MPIARICRITGREFSIQEREADFLERVRAANPLIGSAAPLSTMLPTITPTEFVRRVAVYGNLLHLFWAKSAISGKPTLSRFNPQRGLPVVTPDEFWSDQVDNRNFGRAYDFSRPFFEQFFELFQTAYNLPLGNVNVENSDFVNGAADVKDSYLSFVIISSSDCLYCFNVFRCSDLVDCCFCDGSRYCYASSDLSNCYQCQNCCECEGCQDCFGCWDCRSCTDCFGCFGLERQRFCLFNQQLTEAEYRSKVRAFQLSSLLERKQALATIRQFFAANAHLPKRIVNCENSSGAYLRSCSNMELCFNARDSQDCAYVSAAQGSRDCWRGFFTRSEMCNTGVFVDSYNCHFSYHPFNSQAIWYSFGMYNSCEDCFGCVGLKKNRYCILNRQYSREDYFEIVPRIVTHMISTGEFGEWFPVELAPYSYDEGWTREYFEPLGAAEIARRGYYRRAFAPDSSSRRVCERAAIADRIEDCEAEDLEGIAICCERTGQAFSVQLKELEFYKQHSIPVPSLHWRERLFELVDARQRIPD